VAIPKTGGKTFRVENKAKSKRNPREYEGEEKGEKRAPFILCSETIEKRGIRGFGRARPKTNYREETT